MMMKKNYRQKKLMNLYNFGIIIFCIFALSIFSQNVRAHPPENIDLEYNADNQVLTITITHNTNDLNSHYVAKVEVFKNDVAIIEENYQSQPTINTFTLTFNVSAVAGDVLKAEATCSLNGKSDESLTLGSGNTTSNNSDGPSTPGFEIIGILASVVILALILRRNKQH